MPEMKIKAIAPWFGGKRTLAQDIVQQLGPHTQYFEPFCGSMAVLLAKEPSRQETAIDLHVDLTSLARVIADPTRAPVLYRKLQLAPVSEDLLHQASVKLSEPFGNLPETGCDSRMLDRAYWYFLASWMGRNGVSGTRIKEYQLAVRWTAGGGSPTVRWQSAVESIPAWHRRLLNVVILCRDAIPMLDRFEDRVHTAIYIDTPYLAETRGSTSTSGLYRHDFDNSDQHDRVAEILCRYRNARIVISHYDCPRVRQIYDGWTFIDKSRQKNLHAQNGRGARKKTAPEVLIVNGPEL